MDSQLAVYSRRRTAWIVPALVATLVAGSLAVAATRPNPSTPNVAGGPADAGTTTVSGDGAAAIAGVAPGAAAALAAARARPSVQSGPLSVSLNNSPFSPDGDGVRDTTTLTVVLGVAATLSVVVQDFDGASMKVLANRLNKVAGQSSYTWNGKGGPKNKLVADGAYDFRVTATNADGTFSVDQWVAKDKNIPYPIAPQDIVVVVDSGHGNPDSGAYYQKIREADMNLDIAKRLLKMLASSGVQVVMTRTADVAVNTPPVDVSGNRIINEQDELIVRNDIANLARADLHVVLMNNAYGCHCAHGTETYTSGERTWTPEGVDLARYLQAAHIKRLKAFKSTTWKPNDRGVKLYDFASMRPYKKTIMPRPDFMPSVLVESLFMDHPNELTVLTTPAARAAIATAYFDGITQWLAKRAYGLRYDIQSAPATAEVGSTADYIMLLTNRGNQSSSGWVLEARMVSAVPGQPYDGSPVRGTLVAQLPIPDGLAPGHAVPMAMNGVPVPTVAGNWMVKFDVRLPSGATLQDHGVVGPQLPLTTAVTSPPSPSPSPEPTASDTPSFTPDPGSPSSSAVGGSAPPVALSVDLAGLDATAVPPRLFARPLPYDPEGGRTGVGGTVKWSLFEPWRRYITPIDISPDSIRGQYGLDSDGH